MYLSYTSGRDLTRGWSTPKSIYTLLALSGGYSYSFHAYPNYDPTGRVVPLSWCEFAPPYNYYTSMANLTFS